VVGNELEEFVTLTVAEECSRAEMTGHIRALFRRLRRSSESRVPWAYVIEGGDPDDEVRSHAHVMAPRGTSVEQLWHLGSAHVEWRTGRGELRATASYLSKSFPVTLKPGVHRYAVARGFQPRRVELAGESEREIWAQVAGEMGGVPDEVSSARSWLSEPGPRLVVGWWN
jgi:hypothetical protein